MPSVTPYLAVRDARRAIDFYVDVFGATRRGEPIIMPDGVVGHAELAIGDTVVMLAEEFGDIGHVVADPGGAALRIMVPGVDDTVRRAVAAGASTVVPPSDSGHGRSARIRDPFGQDWIVAEAVTGDGAALYRRWLGELWNGEIDRLAETARTIVTADFVGHWPARPGLANGPDQLADIVRQGRQMIDGCVFDLALGPLVHGDLVAARWVGRGHYAGRPVTFHGHDLLRLDGDRFAEYWVIAEDPTA